MRRPAWPSGWRVRTCLRTGPTRRSWGHSGAARTFAVALRDASPANRWGRCAQRDQKPGPRGQQGSRVTRPLAGLPCRLPVKVLSASSAKDSGMVTCWQSLR